MKKLLGIVVLGLLFCNIANAFFDKTIVDKPKLNKILNKLIKGDFYHCSYSGMSNAKSRITLDGQTLFNKGKQYNKKAIQSIQLIKSGKYYGLIYSSGDRWRHLNNIYYKVSSTMGALSGFYHSYGSDYELDFPGDTTFYLIFKNNILLINTIYIEMIDQYKCSFKDLSDSMKISELRKFNRYNSNY